MIMIMIIIIIVITIKIRPTSYACSLFISMRRLYFPWDRIYWIKEGLSNYGKAFIISWGFVEVSFNKTKRKTWETIKTGLCD